jgi:hypothetical protein
VINGMHLEVKNQEISVCPLKKQKTKEKKEKKIQSKSL